MKWKPRFVFKQKLCSKTRKNIKISSIILCNILFDCVSSQFGKTSSELIHCVGYSLWTHWKFHTLWITSSLKGQLSNHQFFYKKFCDETSLFIWSSEMKFVRLKKNTRQKNSINFSENFNSNTLAPWVVWIVNKALVRHANASINLSKNWKSMLRTLIT